MARKGGGDGEEGRGKEGDSLIKRTSSWDVRVTLRGAGRPRCPGVRTRCLSIYCGNMFSQTSFLAELMTMVQIESTKGHYQR
jgi:hypothetical protein